MSINANDLMKVNSVAGTRIEQDNSNTQIENEAIEGAPIGTINDNIKSKNLIYPGCANSGPLLGRNKVAKTLDYFSDFDSKKPTNGKVNTIAFNPNAPKRNNQLISNIRMYGRVETQVLFPFVICTYRYDDKKGIGISRCSESDKWKENEGIKKATGRALRALVCKLERRPFPQDEKKYMG